jgi:hypothetical protein
MAMSHSTATGVGEDHGALVITGWLTGGDFALDRPGLGLGLGRGRGRWRSSPTAFLTLLNRRRGGSSRWRHCHAVSRPRRRQRRSGGARRGSSARCPKGLGHHGRLRLLDGAPCGCLRPSGSDLRDAVGVRRSGTSCRRSSATCSSSSRCSSSGSPGSWRPTSCSRRSFSCCTGRPGASCARLTESRCAPRRRTSTRKPPPPGPAPGCRTSPTRTCAA